VSQLVRAINNCCLCKPSLFTVWVLRK